MATCACTVLVGLLAFGSSSASALSQRGHEFKGVTLGSAGFGNGQMVEPSGVAVNETTGDIYVVDSGNNRVERFNSKREFVSTWGWGVIDSAQKFEICLASESCTRGVAGHKEGALRSASAIAVDSNPAGPSDPSGGDIYVVAVSPYEENGKEFSNWIVNKYSADGHFLQEIKSAKGGTKFEENTSGETLNGVAVGPDGRLWVYYGENFYDYSNAVESKSLGEVESQSLGNGAPGFAFDVEASEQGGFLAAHEAPLGGGEVPLTAKEVFLEIPVAGTKEIELQALPVVEDLDTFATTGDASDPVTGDAYVDHGGSVAAFDTAGEAIQQFGEGTIKRGTGVAADGSTGNVLVADAGANRVEVFEPEVPHPPTVDEAAAGEPTASSVTLGALLDAHGSTGVTYAFRYSPGPVPRGGEPCEAPCVQVPAEPGGTLPAAYGHVLRETTITGLAPSTLYHFRVWVQAGGVYSEAESGELTFKTQPERPSEALPDARQWQLVSPPAKNGAAIQVIPSEGGLSQASLDGSGMTFVSEGAIGAESEPEGNRAPEMTQNLAFRGGARGWVSKDIDTKHEKSDGVAPGHQEYRQFSADLSLAALQPYSNTNEVVESPPLSSEATEATPYLRRNETCAADPASCFVPLVTPLDVAPETKFGQRVAFVRGNEGLNHVVLQSSAHLTGELSHLPVEDIYAWAPGSPASLKLIDVTPEGEPIPETLNQSPAVGLGFKNGIDSARHAVSIDGSRYVWTLQSNEGSRLYLRSLSQPRSIRLDVRESGVTPSAECAKTVCNLPVFQDATPDDSVIFFLDEERLTKDAGATQNRPDLYSCEVQESEGVPTGCKLTDLSVAAGGQAGNVQGTVIGVTEQAGSPLRAYFVANGALGGAEAGSCQNGAIVRAKEGFTEGPEAQPIASTCGLYVQTRESDGSWSGPRLVQRLSGEDEWDWGTVAGSLERVVARVSPNGEWVAFMSDRSLTGYNTRDRSSGRPAEEVYLYNATSGKTVCASCNPSGARPNALLDQQDSGEGIGPLIDQPLRWTSRRISANIPTYVKTSVSQADYQPRFLGDEGRLFFNSVEGLAPQDTNGKADVYQYEPSGIAQGSCSAGEEAFISSSDGCVALISSGKSDKESAFLDASASGKDVFFVSSGELVPEDRDSSYDVYDASVCGVLGQSACLTSPAASEPACDEVLRPCRPDVPGPPLLGGAASETPSSGNNVSGQHEVLSSKAESTPKPKAKTLTRAQKLKKALAACKKVKKKSRRHACESAARRKYGAAKKKAARKAAHATVANRRVS